MAVMAIVSVAAVIGGEVKFGPLAKFVFVARSAEPDSSAALDAMVVYGDAWSAEDALSAMAPSGVLASALATNIEPDLGLPRFNEPASADMGPGEFAVGRGAFGIGGFAPALGSTAVATSAQNGVNDLPPLQALESPIAIGAPPSPTPEPATWAMMVLGVGAIGLALRRRRRAAMGASI